MNGTSICVAGKNMGQQEALGILAGYWARTPPAFDYPGPGNPGELTREEVVRTRVVSSRISNEQLSFFLSAGSTAPWLAAGPDADLEDADPDGQGLFEEMSDLYWHFAGSAPRGVSFAKVSKVLHVKYPGLYPILDSHLRSSYASLAKGMKGGYPDLGWRRRTWVTIREDLVAARQSGALSRLRQELASYVSTDAVEQERVRSMGKLTDLRLLDILVW